MATTNRQQRQHFLLQLLACGATVAQAAVKARLSERTVYRYLAEDAFRRQLQNLQDETVQCSAARLTTAVPEALKVLMELQAPNMPASIRRAAARDLVQLSQRHRETITLEKRLSALENCQRNAQANPPTPPLDPAAARASAPGATAPSAAKDAGRPRRQRGTHALVNALACGATVAQAATKAGVSQRTAYRRLAEADFRQRLQTLQAEMTQRAADLLLASTVQATKTLLDLLAATTPPRVRGAAARDILELGLGLRQAAEMETRLTNLEIDVAFRSAA